jgi:hypothetical protein
VQVTWSPTATSTAGGGAQRDHVTADQGDPAAAHLSSPSASTSSLASSPGTCACGWTLGTVLPGAAGPGKAQQARQGREGMARPLLAPGRTFGVRAGALTASSRGEGDDGDSLACRPPSDQRPLPGRDANRCFRLDGSASPKSRRSGGGPTLSGPKALSARVRAGESLSVTPRVGMMDSSPHGRVENYPSSPGWACLTGPGARSGGAIVPFARFS